MQVSARDLGQKHGLIVEEMNRVFVKLDLLEGIPDEYMEKKEALRGSVQEQQKYIAII